MLVRIFAPLIKLCVRSFWPNFPKGIKNDPVFGFWNFMGLGGFPVLWPLEALERILELQGCKPNQLMFYPLELFMWFSCAFVSLLAFQATKGSESSCFICFCLWLWTVTIIG